MWFIFNLKITIVIDYFIFSKGFCQEKIEASIEAPIEASIVVTIFDAFIIYPPKGEWK